MSNKRIILSILLSFSIGISAFAQDSEIASSKETYGTKTEFNIGIANIFADPLYDLVLYDYSDAYYPDYVLIPQQPGLVVGMKFHNPKGAFRLSTTFGYSSKSFDDPDLEDDEATMKSFASDLNLGYEWHSNFKRVRVYYGFDVLLGFQNSESKFTSTNDFREGKSNFLKYGLSPLLGVNYFITPNLSIGTEVKLSAMGYSGKTESTVNYGVYPYNNYSESKTDFSGFRTSFGPLGFLSVNIYF